MNLFSSTEFQPYESICCDHLAVKCTDVQSGVAGLVDGVDVSAVEQQVLQVT